MDKEEKFEELEELTQQKTIGVLMLTLQQYSLLGKRRSEVSGMRSKKTKKGTTRTDQF